MDAHLAAADVALRLLTVGHGTATESELAGLLHGAGVEFVVDVRSVPGSRRNPQFSRAQLEMWMPAAGLGYRWEPHLGGFRRQWPARRTWRFAIPPSVPMPTTWPRLRSGRP